MTFEPTLHPPDNSQSAAPQPSPQFRSAPGNWTVVPLIILTLLIVEDLSTGATPESMIENGLLIYASAFFVFTWAFIDYLFRCLQRSRITSEEKRRPPHNMRRSWRWFVFPACFAILLSTGTNWPMKLRVHLSKPALDQFANDWLADKQSTRGPHAVGLFTISDVKQRIDPSGHIAEPWLIIKKLSGGRGHLVYDPTGYVGIYDHCTLVAPNWYTF